MTSICTVTSDDFVLGTLVMLDSFRQTNPWFDGEMLILHDGLTDKNRALFAAALPRARLEPISPELTAQLDTLTQARPGLHSRRARLFSLDAFRFEGPGKMLFCDSDILFRGDVSALFEDTAPLIACPDGATARGKVRDPASFAEIEDHGGEALRSCFNAGVMGIASELRTPAQWRRLLALAVPQSWEGVVTDHTDQLLLNRAFDGLAAPAASEYNLLLLHRADAHARYGLRLADARVLHYNGPAKPWRPETMPGAVTRDSAMLAAYRYWQDAYVALLGRLALKPVS